MDSIPLETISSSLKITNFFGIGLWYQLSNCFDIVGLWYQLTNFFDIAGLWYQLTNFFGKVGLWYQLNNFLCYSWSMVSTY